jgi:hypothetical protein
MDTTKPSLDAQTPSSGASLTERVRAIRARLPGQMLRERIDAVQVCFGPLYTEDQVRRRVAESLPFRFGTWREAILEPIESYREVIPDEALLKYDEAFRRGLFSRFWVASVAYRSHRQPDPWILGEVDGIERYAVIAQWA